MTAEVKVRGLSYLTHRRQLTVEWGHCDPAGIVFNSRFFEFFDHSTWLLFERALALPAAGIGAVYGVSMPLVDAKARFLFPAKLGDLVEIETTIAEFRRSSFTVQHLLWNDSRLAVEGQEIRVWAERDPTDPDRLRLRAKQIPPEVIARMAAQPA
jgi:4-hydroxybenzoyl-CoA thioesterase